MAATIEKLKQAGHYEQAEHLINETRTDLLAKLISLFTELRDLVRDVQGETAVILVSDRRQFAISVDMALAIEKFSPGSIEEIPRLVPIHHNGVARRLAKRAKSKDVVLLIETDSLMAGVDVAALSGAEPVAMANHSLRAGVVP